MLTVSFVLLLLTTVATRVNSPEVEVEENISNNIGLEVAPLINKDKWISATKPSEVALRKKKTKEAKEKAAATAKEAEIVIKSKF